MLRSVTRKELLAYLAGFIDADGSITIVTGSYWEGDNKKIQYRARLSASNCKLAPMRLLQRTFGTGKLRLRHWKGRNKRNWKPNYEWLITATQATKAIAMLLPFLSIKRKQGIYCLRLQKLKDKYTSAQRRWDRKLNTRLQNQFERWKQRCNLLNKRGRL